MIKHNSNEVYNALKLYLRAFFTQDFETMYNLYYQEDLEEFRNGFLEMADNMDEIGENEKLFARLGIENLTQLHALSTKEFILKLLKLITKELDKKYLDRLLRDLKIVHIDATEYYTLVQYEYPAFLFDDWETLEGEVQLIKSNDEWKFFFKSDLNELFKKSKEILNRYYDRKKRDDLSSISTDTELRPFNIIGYKDADNGKVIIEARFTDAGSFSEGLAYAKVINNYGFINTSGEFIIKPQFALAKDFSEGLAAVLISLDEENEKWGFIDKSGKLIISSEFDETGSFSEGLCAVKIDMKWGYINKKGKVKIPIVFDFADDFEDDNALVEMLNEEGDTIEMYINSKGEILEL